jgi:hypothetical protein
MVFVRRRVVLLAGRPRFSSVAPAQGRYDVTLPAGSAAPLVLSRP